MGKRQINANDKKEIQTLYFIREIQIYLKSVKAKRNMYISYEKMEGKQNHGEAQHANAKELKNDQVSIVVINPKVGTLSDLFDTMIHEILHVLHSDFSEKRVREITKMIDKTIDKKTKKSILLTALALARWEF